MDPDRPEPAEVELEDWLFDATAGPERREAEARFVHGHLLKPGDVARTDWAERCAQPPYDRLPVARVEIPPGVILSRDGRGVDMGGGGGGGCGVAVVRRAHDRPVRLQREGVGEWEGEGGGVAGDSVGARSRLSRSI